MDGHDQLARECRGTGLSASEKMLNLRKGEEVEWEITPKGELLLKRNAAKRK